MPNPPIILVGEAYGENEARLGQPFVGPSGVELIRMLGESGLITLTSYDRDKIYSYYETSNPENLAKIWSSHPEVVRTNVFNIHPHANDLESLCGPKPLGIPGYPALLKSKYVLSHFQPHLDALTDCILSHNPNLVVCLGNTPLWALAGRTGITKWRGTTLYSTHCVADFKLLPTFHPSAIMRAWDNRPTAIADLMKASREAAYPEIRRPPREIWIEPDIDDIKQFIKTYITPDTCRLLSVDIETAGSRITCIGFSPRPDLALVIPFDDDRAKNRSFWETPRAERAVWELIRGVLGDPNIPKLFQNGLYDIAFLWRSMRIAVLGAAEDTMLLSHALQPESLKGLGFLGSIYSDEGAWKTEFRQSRTIKRDS